MNSILPLRLAALALVAPFGLAVSLPAAAQADSYTYFGLSAGQGRAKLDEESLAARALQPGISATILERDERDRAYRAFVGWQWNRYLGAEAGYFDLGRSSFNASTTPTGTLNGNLRIRGYNLDLVATMPLGDTVSLIGRAGLAFARTRGSFVGSGGALVASPSPTDRQTNPKVGLGVQVAFTPSVLMRAEAERYRVSDGLGQRGRVNTFNVSLVFPFGRAPAVMPRADLAPLYVEPVLPVDSMFSHDSRELRPEARTAIDAFASRLAGRRYDAILIAGHADRMGEAEHNQQLSQQRADVVKAYLSGLPGMELGRIQSVGKGSSEPLTASADCATPIARNALILCLQRDRRVEIDVTGEL